ncbi:MAG: putative bacteriocin export ABC transporter [Streptococcaceae bacterium]|nr:putative bacteriocin export ABC transporter [Streptococcaceae bacterium]
MSELISVKDLAMTINEREIFSSISFQIFTGEMVAIYGRSGAGKSTLLNTLGLSLPISSGDYYFDGKDTRALSNKEKLLMQRHEISYVFQDYGLVEEETISYNLDIGLGYTKLNKGEKTRTKLNVLQQVGLTKKLNTKVHTLSGGEKQRVALARIILKPSKLILADEPTGSLDDENGNLVLSILADEARKGKAVIIVTHDNRIIERCDKKILLNS